MIGNQLELKSDQSHAQSNDHPHADQDTIKLKSAFLERMRNEIKAKTQQCKPTDTTVQETQAVNKTDTHTQPSDQCDLKTNHLQPVYIVCKPTANISTCQPSGNVTFMTKPAMDYQLDCSDFSDITESQDTVAHVLGSATEVLSSSQQNGHNLQSSEVKLQGSLPLQEKEGKTEKEQSPEGTYKTINMEELAWIMGRRSACGNKSFTTAEYYGNGNSLKHEYAMVMGDEIQGKIDLKHVGMAQPYMKQIESHSNRYGPQYNTANKVLVPQHDGSFLSIPNSKLSSFSAPIRYAPCEKITSDFYPWSLSHTKKQHDTVDNTERSLPTKRMPIINEGLVDVSDNSLFVDPNVEVPSSQIDKTHFAVNGPVPDLFDLRFACDEAAIAVINLCQSY